MGIWHWYLLLTSQKEPWAKHFLFEYDREKIRIISNNYSQLYIQYTVSPWATLTLGPKISQKQCCSSYVLKISVVQGIISVAQEILQKTVKSALLKVNTELFKNRVVSRTALLEVVLLKDLLYLWILLKKFIYLTSWRGLGTAQWPHSWPRPLWWWIGGFPAKKQVPWENKLRWIN